MESVLKILSEKMAWKVLRSQEQLTSAEELEEATELQSWGLADVKNCTVQLYFQSV